MIRRLSHVSLPPGHVAAPVAAIGSLSMLLVCGLHFLGWIDHFDAMAAAWVSRGGAETFPNELPAFVPWLVALGFACTLPLAILLSPGVHRRLILWISSLALIAAWAPVLSLAAHPPRVAAPFIATAWAGVCAIVYAARHRMPGETPADSR